MKKYPILYITEEMISAAEKLVDVVKVNRTIASKIDTLTGILGEFIFAQYFHGDWKSHRVGLNKGDVDFKDIEIKTSAYPFNENLNLLVREDYAEKRKPRFYVQIIIDIQNKKAEEIVSGTKVYIAGWASSEEVDNAPRKDFGSKFGGRGGYFCRYIGLKYLHNMENFKKAYHRSNI
ncbi:MAG: hypothetical protein GXO87_14195 [Chlorobi bacterium]|nr:hypothetical protein [Chlorobiota bacterium]